MSVWVLLKKDLKDFLRDPMVYVGFVLPFVLFAALGGLFVASVPSGPLPVSVYVPQTSNYSELIASYLKVYGVNISGSPSNAIAMINVSETLPIGVTIKFNITSVDQYEYARVMEVMDAIGSASQNISYYLLSRAGVSNPSAYLHPLKVSYLTLINGREFNGSPVYVFESAQMEDLVLPLALASLSLTVSEMSATFVSTEKEEKTLETLLSMPVPRRDIMVSKVASSLVVSVLGTAFYFVGLFVYSDLVFEAQAPILVLNPTALLAFLAALALSAVFSGALGVVVGLLSEDMRVANTFMGVLMIPVLLPAFLYLMGGSISTAPPALRAILLALPPTYPIAIFESFITGRMPPYALPGLAVSFAETVAIIFVSSWLLEEGRAQLILKRGVEQ